MIAVAGGLAVAAAVQAAVMPWTTKAMRVQASTSTAPVVIEDILKFTFEYSNHPTSIVLHSDYSAPSNTSGALYDSGDGVWRSFTSRTIPIVASNKYVSFKGDWRKSGGTYYAMFQSALTVTNARCRTSGRLAYAPTTNAAAYHAIFFSCSQITSFDDNPFQPLTGSPGADMFNYSFYNMTGITNLPTGFLNTSGLTGKPAANMFNNTCYNISGVTRLPDGFMNTSGLTGAPASSMFYSACRSMSGVKNIPAGFLNTSGLTGAPAGSMFYQACAGMSGATNLPSGFLNTSGLTGAPAASMFYAACQSMSSVSNLPDGFLNTSGLTGAPASSMFQSACAGMNAATNLPAGFMNTAGLTGAPAATMFGVACQNMYGVKSLPDGFMDTRGLTGAPAADMFYAACYNMTGVTNLPTGFLSMSGLNGAPAGNMFYAACFGMSGVVAGDFNMSSNITFATTNIASSIPSAFASMTKWTGTVYWGASRIYDAIPNPATDANVFQNSTNVPGYATMGANWK
jgi:hypothetical protein